MRLSAPSIATVDVVDVEVVVVVVAVEVDDVFVELVGSAALASVNKSNYKGV